MTLTLEEKVAHYYLMNENKKLQDKELKTLNADLKQELSSLGEDKIVFDSGIKIEKGTQNRSKVNTDRLLALLDELELTEQATKMIRVPLDDVVEKLVFNGDISPERYLECVDEQYVETLKVTKAKKVLKGGIDI